MPSFRNGGNVGAVEYRWDEGQAGAIQDEVDLLAYLSNLIGQDPTLTQPGGGNSSLKGQEADFASRKVAVLRVKGSGTDLASIGRAGFTGLRLEELALLRQQKRLSDEELVAFLRATMLDGSEPAPSIETPLHAMLPFRFIVHTHDFASQALTDTKNPEALVREAFG
ncbi:MAG TPA: bifunctional rhamnulose-1-phosphate aldolase/short-chain dehydrogenase, partial [Vicinamibacteria bacterium]|nr:bifunctional rhamnulose-1-phosphate aldolase/short-chain dehydrogenase [Vicinamibacteria bacterium]